MIAQEETEPYEDPIFLLGAVVGAPLAKLVFEKESEPLRAIASRSAREWEETVTVRAAHVLEALGKLARRIAAAPTTDRQPIRTSLEVFAHVHDMALYPEERFVALLLDTRNKVLRRVQVAQGALNTCVLLPRDVLRHAVREGAARIVVAHNHPSGDPTPSREDARLTLALAQAGEVVGIPLLDHLIVGEGERYFSFRDSGILRSPSEKVRWEILPVPPEYRSNDGGEVASLRRAP